MKRIYMDNGATSFPKAPNVAEAVYKYITENGCNVNRSSYENAANAEDILLDTRYMLCNIFDFDKPSNVVFTSGITESLNCVIKGLLKKDDHCIISGFEHNSVMRPINSIGAKWTIAECDEYGNFNNIENLFEYNTKLVVMTHSSNVFGNVLKLKKLGEICKSKNIPFVIDTAQTAGHINVSFKELNCDVLCFAGHKGLLAPQGIGGMIMTDEMAKLIPPLIEGGTGSVSHTIETPEFMPDKFEAGTMNIPAIYGLNAALKYIIETKIENIQSHEEIMRKAFVDGVEKIDGFKVVQLKNSLHTSVVSITCDFMDIAELSYILESQFGIETRCGLHCSPYAHKTMGTYPEGTLRFSFGFNTNLYDINAVLSALYKIKSIKNTGV